MSGSQLKESGLHSVGDRPECLCLRVWPEDSAGVRQHKLRMRTIVRHAATCRVVQSQTEMDS